MLIVIADLFPGTTEGVAPPVDTSFDVGLFAEDIHGAIGI